MCIIFDMPMCSIERKGCSNVFYCKMWASNRILVTDSIANSKSTDDWLWLSLLFTHHFAYYFPFGTCTHIKYQITQRDKKTLRCAIAMFAQYGVRFVCNYMKTLNVWIVQIYMKIHRSLKEEPSSCAFNRIISRLNVDWKMYWRGKKLRW